jgi:3-oxoacyl-[acyl-carrier-protein] synthase-1
MALCIVGGVDSYFEAETMTWLVAQRQLLTGSARDGFHPGEAAGFVVLMSDDTRRQLELPSLGVVRGFGSAIETKLIKTDAINLGEALGAALTAAVSTIDLASQAPEAVYCDINGERYRSEEWGFALTRMPSQWPSVDYVAPADCWGDVGAASGPLYCGLAVQAWLRRYARGPRAVAWAGSEAGLRTALLLESPARSSS